MMARKKYGWESCNKCAAKSEEEHATYIAQSICVRPPSDLRMQCQWYHETRTGSGRYIPYTRTVNVNKKFVHVSSCLGLVELDYHSDDWYYTLVSNGQMERFKRLMNTIN